MGGAVDDYELTTADDDETVDPYAICDGDDCRAPRAGPFLTDHESGLLLCYRCFISDVLRIDLDEVGIIE
jgi:hypothetical protein